MTTTATPPTPDRHSPPPPSRGWFPQLLLRLHFFAGVFVGPFILVAALSGALYALTPQIERVVFAEALTAASDAPAVPLADQVRAAQSALGEARPPSAVRPAPDPGDSTRVMFAEEGLGESESRAVFVDPATLQIRGDYTVYGTSGALPLRTWIDQLHRSLHLGDAGRLYSELAASWLGIVALAGLGLVIARRRRMRGRAERPAAIGGHARIARWHRRTGLWVLVGALFLSATGITWSQFGGASVSGLRATLGWETPTIDTALADSAPDSEDAAGEHAGHGVAASPAGAVDPATFDDVLAVAQGVNVNTGLVEIRPPSGDGQAWLVQEIQRSYPTEVDQVAVDGGTLDVVDRVDFDDYPVMAKLARWGIDIHMGSMFGVVNQLVLAAAARGIAALTVWGYVMWWRRRPTRRGALAGRAPGRGALARSPWWGPVAVAATAAPIAVFLPALGVSLAAFVVLDVVLGAVAARRRRSAAA